MISSPLHIPLFVAVLKVLLLQLILGGCIGSFFYYRQRIWRWIASLFPQVQTPEQAQYEPHVSPLKLHLLEATESSDDILAFADSHSNRKDYDEEIKAA